MSEEFLREEDYERIIKKQAARIERLEFCIALLQRTSEIRSEIAKFRRAQEKEDDDQDSVDCVDHGHPGGVHSDPGR